MLHQAFVHLVLEGLVSTAAEDLGLVSCLLLDLYFIYLGFFSHWIFFSAAENGWPMLPAAQLYAVSFPQQEWLVGVFPFVGAILFGLSVAS